MILVFHTLPKDSGSGIKGGVSYLGLLWQHYISDIPCIVIRDLYFYVDALSSQFPTNLLISHI
jgi:hypothetical protein